MNETTTTTTLPIPSLSLEALLGRRDAAHACLERIRAAVEEYQQLGEALKLGEGYGRDDNGRTDHKWREPVENNRYAKCGMQDAEWLAWAKTSVDAALWEHLLALSGLRTFLDAKARADWDKAIEENKTAEMTAANVEATFRALHEKRGDFFERGVVAIFRSLSWVYATNKPQMFGKRIILRNAWGGWGRGDDALDDLNRAFHILDGKPEPDHRQSPGRELRAAYWGPPPAFANEYLSIKTFKNRNGHLTFLRPDLVEQLNRIVAKHHPNALPSEAA